MTAFVPKVTRIKGLSDRRRLPRLGVIRLGLKVQKGDKTYPKETEYFVVPPEVEKIYGKEPKELDIMLPINEIDSVFPQAYKMYGSSKGLVCQGDGECAYCVDPAAKEMIERECPCKLLEDKKCKQTGTLLFMLPKVSVGGIYQITTSSYNSIVDINSGIDYVAALLGRFALVPLKLRRVKTETHHDDKKQNHYTLQVIFDADINTLNTLRSDTTRVLEHPRYQLPAPAEVNPELDPPDIIEAEEAGQQEEQPPQAGQQNGATASPGKTLYAEVFMFWRSADESDDANKATAYEAMRRYAANSGVKKSITNADELDKLTKAECDKIRAVFDTEKQAAEGKE